MSGYNYEKSFTDLWQKLGQEFFQSSLGEAKYSKNSKKVKTQWGEVIVAKTHPLAQCPNGLTHIEPFTGSNSLDGQ